MTDERKPDDTAPVEAWDDEGGAGKRGPARRDAGEGGADEREARREDEAGGTFDPSSGGTPRVP